MPKRKSQANSYGTSANSSNVKQKVESMKRTEQAILAHWKTSGANLSACGIRIRKRLIGWYQDLLIWLASSMIEDNRFAIIHIENLLVGKWKPKFFW